MKKETKPFKIVEEYYEIVKELIAGGFSEYRGVVNSDAKYRWGKSWGHSDGKVAVWTSSGRCFIAKDTEENRKRAEELARKMGGSGNANVPASLE